MAYWTGKGKDTIEWGGTLEATYFKGDGHLLTNIPGVTGSYLSSGDNISLLNNDAGYLTSVSGGIGTLQQVTDAGSETTNSIISPNITGISGALVTLTNSYIVTSGALLGYQVSGNYQISGNYQASGNYQYSGAYQVSGLYQSSGLYQASGTYAPSGAYVVTSGALYSHTIGSFNPHGTTLYQTTLIVGSQITSGLAAVLNMVYWSGTTPLTAGSFPVGTIYVQYTA
jgi:hypothetical protein